MVQNSKLVARYRRDGHGGKNSFKIRVIWEVREDYRLKISYGEKGWKLAMLI